MRNSMRRMLSVVLAIMMVVSVMAIGGTSASAAPLAAGEKLYLKTDGVWSAGDERFAIWFFEGSGADHFVEMEATAEANVYVATVPEGGYSKVIFVRMSKANSTTDWSNKWNQTGNLTLSADYNCFTVNTWDGQTSGWSVYGSTVTEPAPEAAYYVVGTMNGWTLADEAYKMTKSEDGMYTFIIDSVPASTDGTDVRFKVNDGTWTNAYPEQDYVINDAVGKKCVITFNESTKTVYASYEADPTEPAPTFAKDTTLYLTPNTNWASGNARFAAYFFISGTDTNEWVSMTDEDADGVYEVKVPAEGYTTVIFCRMNPEATDNNWDNKWNQTDNLIPDTTGLTCYVVTEGADNWDNVGAWAEYTKPATSEPSEDTTPSTPVETVYYIVGTMNGWTLADTAYQMTKTADGVYTFTLGTVNAGDEFKVNNGTWDVVYPAGDNYKITANMTDCVVTFNATTGEITVAGTTEPTEPAATFTKDTVVYLAPGVWNADGATFAAYFYNNDVNVWVAMTDANEDGTYEVTVPADGYTGVIFGRMNPTGELDWGEANVWNQTTDLTPAEGLNCYSITDWNAGEWTKYEAPQEPSEDPEPSSSETPEPSEDPEPSSSETPEPSEDPDPSEEPSDPTPSTPDEPKNGIHADGDSLYYYVDGVITGSIGLIQIDGYFYYVTTSGMVVRGKTYFISRTNLLMPQGHYEFDMDGRMVNPPAIPEDATVVEDVANNVEVKREAGVCYYYKDGQKVYGGLVIINGDYYYANHNCKVITGMKYYISFTNGLKERGTYEFDETGKLILTQ